MSINVAPLARPVSTGCFCLPAIDASVPAQFNQGLKRSQTLARFAAAAAAVGVPLPEGSFLNMEQVVKAQWSQFIESHFAAEAFRGLPAEPVFRVTDELLQVMITSRSNLNVYRLKPVVEVLEACAAGLGWFVQSVLQQATSHAHEVYDMTMATYMLDAYHWNLDEYTDEEYARILLMEMGQDPPKSPIPAETMESLRADYSFWPSDILAEVDGHAHLLGQMSVADSPARITMTTTQAKRWLGEHPRHKRAPVVQVALELLDAFIRDKRRAFLWNGNEDETETMGALCFIAWDEPRLLLQAVQHHEENQYNGGQAVEAFARCTLDLSKDHSEADLRRLASSTSDYFNRWALLGKLLSHFPTWEDDDET